MTVELSIIMPCLNEAETIQVCIQKAKSFLARSGICGEIIIGDNGSTDGSQIIAMQSGASVINVSVKGYGSAIYGAVIQASGRYCIVGDADDSYDFTKLQSFVDKLREGNDLVMGNRFLGGISRGAMPWKNRYIGNPLLSGFGQLLFKCPASDFHCGLRGFSREAFEAMDLRTTGMEFASEMLIKATLLGMKIAEVPTTLKKDGRSRPPHLRPYKDGWRHLRFMLLFSPDWLFLYPGLTFIAVGGLASLILLWRPIRLGSIHLGIDSLLYFTTMIEVGVQSVFFAILSHGYATQEGLLPTSIKTNWINRFITLERGLALGGASIFFGLTVMARAIIGWSHVGFGNLDVEHVARVVIGSSLCFCLGFETIFASFMLSTFKLSLQPMSQTPRSRGLV